MDAATSGETCSAASAGRPTYPTIAQQSAGAFVGDIGVSNRRSSPPPGATAPRPKPPACAAPNGDSAQYGNLEAPDKIMAQILFYRRNLAVPARRDVDDPIVLRGKRLFYEIGCAACHAPTFATGATAESRRSPAS